MGRFLLWTLYTLMRCLFNFLFQSDLIFHLCEGLFVLFSSLILSSYNLDLLEDYNIIM